MPQKKRKAWLGIDVGYSKSRRTTGVCVLDVVGGIQHLDHILPADFPCVISDIKVRHTIAAAAIDGPLIPAWDLSRHHQIAPHRECEKMLSKGPFLRTMMPGSAGSLVGQALTAAARRAAIDMWPGSHVFEAFPNAFLGSMLPLDLLRRVAAGRGEKCDAYWVQCLRTGVLAKLWAYVHVLPEKRCGPQLERIRNSDERAAYVCALTARIGPRGTALGGMDGLGMIWLPPWRFVQPWAQEALTGRRSQPA